MAAGGRARETNLTVMAASDGHWSPEVHWNDDVEPDWSKGVLSVLRLYILPFGNQKQNHFRSKILSLSHFRLALQLSEISYRLTLPNTRAPIPLLSSPFLPLISRLLQILFFFAEHWLLILLRYRPSLILMDTHTLNSDFFKHARFPL